MILTEKRFKKSLGIRVSCVCVRAYFYNIELRYGIIVSNMDTSAIL